VPGGGDGFETRVHSESSQQVTDVVLDAVAAPSLPLTVPAGLDGDDGALARDRVVAVARGMYRLPEKIRVGPRNEGRSSGIQVLDGYVRVSSVGLRAGPRFISAGQQEAQIRAYEEIETSSRASERQADNVLSDEAPGLRPLPPLQLLAW
jgi:hypothetical protein